MSRPAPLIGKGLPGVTRPADNTRLSMLIYGAAGTGKTVFAGTAADDERSAPVLFVDAEGGTMSLRNPNIEVFRLTAFEDVRRITNYFRQEGASYYKTVVLDSMSELGWLSQVGILRDPMRKGSDPDSLEYGEWNRYIQQMKDMVRFFRDQRVNLIATALEAPEGDTLMPSLTGKKVRSDLPGIFDIVGRLATVPVVGADGKTPIEKRRLALGSSPRFVAKDRSNKYGLLPSFIDEPTVTKLLDRIESAQKEVAPVSDAKGAK